jgi:hypothetical protein
MSHIILWLGIFVEMMRDRSFLKSRGHIGAQRELELEDGPKGRRLRRLPISAFARVFDALRAILDFKFSLRLPSSVRFKGRWLHSSGFGFAWTRSAARQSECARSVLRIFSPEISRMPGSGCAECNRVAHKVLI